MAILLPSHGALFGQAAGIAVQKEGAVKSAGQHSRDWQDASASSPPEVHHRASVDSACGDVYGANKLDAVRPGSWRCNCLRSAAVVSMQGLHTNSNN